MPGTILAPKFQVFDSVGDPLSGGKIHTYDAGTADAKTTYSDAALTSPQTNPIVLNSRGEPTNPIWFSGTAKIIVTDSADVEIYSFDNVRGIGGMDEGTDYTITGNFTFSGDTTGALIANQSNAAGAIPAAHLTQADVSEEIVEIVSAAGVGNAVELVGAKTLTTTMFIKLTVNGSVVYIPAGTIA